MTTADTTAPQNMLDKVRKLLAKAEAEGCTPAEAEALTAKAAELMARYGIDRARLGALHPGSDKPADRIFDIPNPWAQVHAHLLAGLAGAMGCQCILLTSKTGGHRVHVFGYASDLERADVLYTSLLLQMHSAARHDQLRWAAVPKERRGSRRAWNRSYLLGFVTAVIGRVRDAEARARATAKTEDAASGGPSTELVLADRAVVIRRSVQEAYPVTRRTRITYSGGGYGDGYAKGQQANIGGTGLGRGNAGALGR
jgi:Protein of unknown function (DUF2786)